jgi:catechol 2,3-dioxygenase-like lactoylglutathione lyase family enzyme
MTRHVNEEFDIRGINHLALVSSDMARTVDFYSGVLGMPLVKTIELPHGLGQHFFFDVGNGDCLAFFWFADAPKAQPGIAAAANLPTSGKSIASAHGSMNHVAFNVPAEKIEDYYKKLLAKGLKPGAILNHDDSPQGGSLQVTPSTFVRSIYFFDPDGILLEFAAWTRAFDPARDATHAPVDARGRPVRA